MNAEGTSDELAEAARIRELRTQLDRLTNTGIGIGHSLGVTVESLSVGRTVCACTPSAVTLDVMNGTHVGLVSTLMDTAMGNAVFTATPPGRGHTTLELAVTLVRAVTAEEGLLTCEGWTVHVGASTAVAAARVTDRFGRLVAHGTCTCLLL